MSALNKRIKDLGLEDKAIENGEKSDAKKAFKEEWKAKSASSKSLYKKDELIAIIDDLTL